MDLALPLLAAARWLFTGCALACVALVIIGPRTADRLVALNVLSGVVLALLVLRGVEEGKALYLDVALVYDIFGFLGFLAVSRFLKGKSEEGKG